MDVIGTPLSLQKANECCAIKERLRKNVRLEAEKELGVCTGQVIRAAEDANKEATVAGVVAETAANAEAAEAGAEKKKRRGTCGGPRSIDIIVFNLGGQPGESAFLHNTGIRSLMFSRLRCLQI